MTEQLKPCPFCGGIAKAYERTCDKSDRYDPSHRAFPIVRCGSCGCCAVGRDWTEPDTALKQWNRRAQPAQAGAEPVAWRGYTVTNGYTLHHYYGEAHRVASQIEPLYTHPPARVPLTERDVELINGMIEVQLHHAQQCDRIANRPMAEKQKAWDMERVELLQKMLAAHGIGGGK